jgi:DNA-binding transcriptional ArsR family regulator
MATVVSLQPTLWQTCRIMANRLRLKMFRLIVHEPGQTVSALAGRVHVSIAVASQYLRVLEAGGFLEARRNERSVEYRPKDGAKTQSGLPHALAREFENKRAVETVFKLLTAFTHPRRIEVYQSLAGRTQTLEELVRSTGIPWRPLLRHLSKLRSRGFVLHRGVHPRQYMLAEHPNAFGRALAQTVVAGCATTSDVPAPEREVPGILADQDDAFID